VIASTCLVDLYPVSVVGLWLMIYKLEKLLDEQFQAKLLSSSPSGNSELKAPHAFGIPNCITPPPPCLQNSSPKNPTSSSEFQDAAPGMVWIFSGITHLRDTFLGLQTDFTVYPRFYHQLLTLLGNNYFQSYVHVVLTENS